MKPEIAKIWIDALRSGEYTQGKQALKFTKGGKCYHCCLGVLCELYDKYNEEKLVQDIKYNTMKDTTPVVSFNMETEFLPEAVREWAGLENHRGIFRYPYTNNNNRGLMCLNDTGHSFKEISDVIEQNVDVL